MIKSFRLLSLALILAGPAAAHDWYDPTCCSGRDCAPVPITSVRPVASGFQVDILRDDHPLASHDIHTTIPYGDERIIWSQDGEYHACLGRGRYGEMAIICLYVPGNGA